MAKPLCKRVHSMPSLETICKRRELSMEDLMMQENSWRPEDSGSLSGFSFSGISLEHTSIPEKTTASGALAEWMNCYQLSALSHHHHPQDPSAPFLPAPPCTIPPLNPTPLLLALQIPVLQLQSPSSNIFLSMASVTWGQLQIENVKWKITEINKFIYKQINKF